MKHATYIFHRPAHAPAYVERTGGVPDPGIESWARAEGMAVTGVAVVV